MGNEVSNEALMGVLLDIKGDIGELKANSETQKTTVAEHAQSIQRLQISQAKQRGFVAAISTVGAVFGAGAGGLIDYLVRK